MPHPLQMFYGNLSQLGKKSNSEQYIARKDLKSDNLIISGISGTSFFPKKPITYGFRVLIRSFMCECVSGRCASVSCLVLSLSCGEFNCISCFHF